MTDQRNPRPIPAYVLESADDVKLILALHSRETERVLAPMKEAIEAARLSPFQRLKSFRKGRARMVRLANALSILREGRI